MFLTIKTLFQGLFGSLIIAAIGLAMEGIIGTLLVIFAVLGAIVSVYNCISSYILKSIMCLCGFASTTPIANQGQELSLQFPDNSSSVFPRPA
jgi:hypothetical protein